jgi:hypothetical protein
VYSIIDVKSLSCRLKTGSATEARRGPHPDSSGGCQETGQLPPRRDREEQEYTSGQMQRKQYRYLSQLADLREKQSSQVFFAIYFSSPA